jgi:tRNA-guanine transglycosylase
MKPFDFRITKKDSKSGARLGEIHTPHGTIQTPAFVPVGTQATIKSLAPNEIHELGVELFFVNTYHTYLRPGLDVIRNAGGLHGLMGWDRAIITDSGGFQVFSLARPKFSPKDRDQESPSLVTINEDGVTFRSHWDGTKHEFTPESSMQYQWDLGSDIHIAFDDCTGYPITEKRARASMERTHRWAERSLAEHKRLADKAAENNKPYQALYGVIQGSIYEDLRKESAKFICGLDTDGIAIGGVSVGETKQEMQKVLDWVTPILPEEKPRHLLGVGEIDDIFPLIAHGMDTFDCVQATRLARMGRVYVTDQPHHEIDITKSTFAQDFSPLEKNCTCFACRTFTRAYIHHLFHVKELLGYRLTTIHNIHFIHTLVDQIREAIAQDRFLDLAQMWGYNG